VAAIGARAHDLGRGDAAFLAEAAVRAGVSCLQLAPAKALSDCPVPPEPMGEGWARSVGAALAARGIGVAVLGCYVDVCSPDARARVEAVDRLALSLRLAPAFGSRVVATETPLSGGGSAAALASLRDSLRELAALAEGLGATLCVEPVWGHAVDTPREMARLLDAVGSRALGVILDPVNLVDPGSGGDPAAPALEALALFGERVAALHVKDFLLRGGSKARALPGEGLMDWARLVSAASEAAPRAPLILEDQDARGLAAGIALLSRLG
jgi:L-ribulose-5-phosphate 3-epimerase